LPVFVFQFALSVADAAPVGRVSPLFGLDDFAEVEDIEFVRREARNRRATVARIALGVEPAIQRGVPLGVR
jgi:hypothetical protein